MVPWILKHGAAIVSAVVAVGLGVGPRSVFAFCRSTTCKGAACTSDNDGCPDSGAKLFWRGACIGYSMQRNGTQNLPMDKVKAAVRGAFRAWSDVDCGNGKPASLLIGELNDTGCITSEYNSGGPNINVVLFRDNDWQYKNTDNTLAKAIAHFDAKTGEILDADIEVNTASNHFTLSNKDAEFDLQTVLTHEVGHFIGLAHSPDPAAVMYASYERGSVQGRTLSPDDVAALCAAYPPDRKATCNLQPSGGFDNCDPAVAKTAACTTRRAAPSALGWLPLLLAVAVPGLRRARAKDLA